MGEEKKELKPMSSYLVTRGWGNQNPIKITIEEVTKTCYKILWEQSGNKTYMTKGNFKSEYQIIEEL